MKPAVLCSVLAAFLAPGAPRAGTWQHLGPDGHLFSLMQHPASGFPAWGSNDCLYIEDGSYTEGNSPGPLMYDAQAAPSGFWYTCGESG